MTSRALTRRLQTAFSHAAPAAPVTAAAEPAARRVTPVWRRCVALAAALALAIGFGAAYTYSQNFAITAEVLLDVNPSVKLCLSRDDTVRKAVALNDDAAPVLETLDLVGKTADEAVELLVDALVEHGFLDADANSVLVSVNAKDTEKGNALGNRLCDSVETAAKRHKFQGAVLCQNLHVTEELRAKAEEYGISPGRALLIEKILAADPDGAHTFEELAELKVNELNLLGGTKAKDVVCRGQAGKGKGDGNGNGNGNGNGQGKNKTAKDATVEEGVAPEVEETALSKEAKAEQKSVKQAAKQSTKQAKNGQVKTERKQAAAEQKQLRKQDGSGSEDCTGECPADGEQKQLRKQDGSGSENRGGECPADGEQKQLRKQDGSGSENRGGECPADGEQKQLRKQDGSCDTAQQPAADPA